MFRFGPITSYCRVELYYAFDYNIVSWVRGAPIACLIVSM